MNIKHIILSAFLAMFATINYASNDDAQEQQLQNALNEKEITLRDLGKKIVQQEEVMSFIKKE